MTTHGWPCGCCGAMSETCYRCSECGHDLAADGTTAGREATQ